MTCASVALKAALNAYSFTLSNLPTGQYELSYRVHRFVIVRVLTRRTLVPIGLLVYLSTKFYIIKYTFDPLLYLPKELWK